MVTCRLLQFLFFLALFIAMANAQGQTCNAAITATAPDSRFQVNGDGTVSDLWTGLMWQQCSVGQSGGSCETGSASLVEWSQALTYVLDLNSGAGYAGYTDWRLPNKSELASLVENSCISPAINLTIFPNTPSATYWSSSPAVSNANYAFSLTSDGRDKLDFRTLTLRIRLVRTTL